MYIGIIKHIIFKFKYKYNKVVIFSKITFKCILSIIINLLNQGRYNI